IVLTIASYLRQTSQPHIAEVGRIANTEHYRNINRHEVETWSKLLLLRIDENITFSNADYINDFILERLTHRPIKHIILICTSVSHIDSTALEALESMSHTLSQQGMTLHFSEVKGPVMDKLEQSCFLEKIKPGQLFFRTIDGVDKLKKCE
ncbi:MAG: sodium-independent anion transporter, partial [Methylococcales bacterium]|nr:sodium-independent anion transporter [Methylococcales bacterium]